MRTSKEKVELAARLEAAALKLREQAQMEGEAQTQGSAKQQPMSPRTNLPVAHPESQEVERELYRLGISLAGMTEEEAKEQQKNKDAP